MVARRTPKSGPVQCKVIGKVIGLDEEKRLVRVWVPLPPDGDPTVIETLDRAARRRILGLPPPINRGRLAKRVLRGQPLSSHERQFIADAIRGKRRTASPKSIDIALKRNEIAQSVLYFRAMHPDWKEEAIIALVREGYGISRTKVFDALRALSPEQRSTIKASARAFAEWQARITTRTTGKRRKV
jgi:hypothetical protein